MAEEYTRRIAGELADKPFDRELLDRLAEEWPGAGPVCDLGCGPGHIGRYLADRGVELLGVDLSSGMLEQARTLNPGITYLQGDMRELPVPDSSWAGIVCFYAIVHLLPEALPAVFQEFRRVLRGGGRVVLAFHVGDEGTHVDELWGRPVSLDSVLHDPSAVVRALEGAGFRVLESRERDPYPEVEYQSRRAYIQAVRDLDH